MKYKIPDINEVMGTPNQDIIDHDKQALIDQGWLLTKLLDDFNVVAKVTNICPGPVITTYELTLGSGTKTSSIEKLSMDLAMGLKSKSIRIIPITERSVVGVEIPNTNPSIIYLKDILNTEGFSLHNDDGVNVALGVDIYGNPVQTDLTKSPHMLIAGQTGAGKSVGINTFLISMLASKRPDELKLILMDMKIVELSPYNSIPHLLTPVITDKTNAIRALEWVIKEMDGRYQLLADAGVRNLQGYNKKSKKKMPYIVVVIDEMADLMMTGGKTVESLIVRIAQKSRATGIHLILATQRPSVDVITGLIKANVPSRIGFQTASQVDSRIITDKNGCEKLLGKGDMLFQDVSSSDVKRVHGSFVEYSDIDAMIKTCSAQGKAEHINFGNDIKITIHGQKPKHELDPKLIRLATELLGEKGILSVSRLQRKLKISYAQASEIVKHLKEEQRFPIVDL